MDMTIKEWLQAYGLVMAVLAAGLIIGVAIYFITGEPELKQAKFWAYSLIVLCSLYICVKILTKKMKPNRLKAVIYGCVSFLMYVDMGYGLAWEFADKTIEQILLVTITIGICIMIWMYPFRSDKKKKEQTQQGGTEGDDMA